MSDRQIHNETASPIAAPKQVLVIAAVMVMLINLGMDFYLPALPGMAEAFGLSLNTMQTTVPVFLLGVAFGQFIGGPTSDQIGRRPIVLIGLALFILSTTAFTFTPGIDTLFALRAVQGIGAGMTAVVVAPMLRDLFDDQMVGPKIAAAMLISMIVQLFTPSLGAAISTISWQTVFASMAIFAALFSVFYFFRFPETNTAPTGFSPTRLITGHTGVLTQTDGGRLLALRYILVMIPATGIMYAFVTTSAFVYMEYAGLTKAEFALVFAASFLVLSLCTALSMKRMQRVSPYKLLGQGVRLQWLIVLTLLIVALSGTRHVMLIFPPLALSAAFMGMVNPHGMALFMRLFRRNAGSANAAFATAAFTSGAVCGGLATYFYDGTLVPVALVMLGATTISNLFYLSIPKQALDPELLA